MLNLKLSHKGILIVALTLVFQLAFVAVLALLLKNAEELVEEERHVREVIFQINKLSGLIDNASIGFAQQIRDEDDPRSENFQRTYGKFLKQLPLQLDLIKTLTRGSPHVLDVNELAQMCLDGASIMEKCREACIKNTPERFVLAVELQETSRKITRHIAQILKDYEHAQQVKMDDQAQSKKVVVAGLAVGIVLDVLIAVLLVVAFTRGIGRRVERVGDNAVRLAARLPLLPPLEPSDEIGVLDQTFHAVAQTLAEAARKEQAMITNAVDLICSIDAKGTFVNINPACKSILGYAPDELIGRRFVEIIDEHDRARTLEQFQEAVKSQSPMQFENVLCTKDGGAVNAGWAAHWSQSEQALFCVVHDITQRKQIERLKADFVATVSHDLRSPLTSIQLVMEMTEMGAYGSLSEDGRKRIAGANAEVDRLIALVNGLLSIEKLESGVVQLQLSELQASDVVEPCLHSVHGLASRKKLELEAHNEDNPRFDGDKDRLTQVVVNLLSNAIKFSPEGKRIILSVKALPHAVRFEVIDQGKGVAENMQAQIFERFKQVDRSDETQKGGSGLGLSICKAIIECHKGTIGVLSQPGEGSTFWFELPLANAAVGAE